MRLAFSNKRSTCELQNYSDTQWIYKKYTAKFGWIKSWLQPNKCGQIANNNFSAFTGYHLTLKILFQSSSLLPACVLCFLMFLAKPGRHLESEAVEVRELLLLQCIACVSVLVLIMYLCLVSHAGWHWAGTESPGWGLWGVSFDNQGNSLYLWEEMQYLILFSCYCFSQPCAARRLLSFFMELYFFSPWLFIQLQLRIYFWGLHHPARLGIRLCMEHLPQNNSAQIPAKRFEVSLSFGAFLLTYMSQSIKLSSAALGLYLCL